MKKCSFCAQEIPSDAVLRMFCNHAQPAPRVGTQPPVGRPGEPRAIFVLAAFAAVAAMSLGYQVATVDF